MIRSLYVDNFKGLNDFVVELPPLAVLIGANGSGKSTILQAVDLLCNLPETDVNTYVKERKWNLGDLKSHLNTRRHITFRATLELPVNGGTELVEWEIVLNPVKEKDKIELVKERISSKTRNRVLLKKDPGGLERYDEEKQEFEHFPPLHLAVSLLNTIDTEKDKKKFPTLVSLKAFTGGIDSFQLLSTERMRKSHKGKADSLGAGGEKLAGFIHGLGARQKKRLEDRLRKYIPFFNGITTQEKTKFHWVEMNIEELFEGVEKPVSIRTAHTSDGILRMIAIVALAEVDKKSGLILLDEIEDGINPYLAAQLAADLKEVSELNQRQVIVTTHSSVLLDYFPAESIVFLWRNKRGTVRSRNLFDSEELKASLEYMHPGEAWINMSEEEIIRKLGAKPND